MINEALVKSIKENLDYLIKHCGKCINCEICKEKAAFGDNQYEPLYCLSIIEAAIFNATNFKIPFPKEKSQTDCVNKVIMKIDKQEIIEKFGFDPDDIGNRPRGWWLEGENLCVKTRDGAANPICAEAMKFPNFINTEEDNFDCTYRYYYYSPLEKSEK